MIKRKIKRVAAFLMAVILGVASVIGYGGFCDKGMAVSEAAGADNITYVFEEGYGTKNEFDEDDWTFGGQYLDENNKETPLDDSRKSAVVDDKEYLNKGKVIRLIRGVKAQTTNKYLEGDNSYNTYRTGRASLDTKDAIKLNSNADFFVKFTFSMPEAVVNTSQTGGDQFAREVGGDGIAFVMTSKPGQLAHAGSGIGYQGMEESIAIELDSFFNGVYYYPATSGSNNYENWDFDNQLYLHNDSNNDGNKNYGSNIGADYGNYVNPGHNERFDHIAFTENGRARIHGDSIYYINHLDPTEMVNGQYVNLANRYGKDVSDAGSVGTVTERSSSECTTRFADAGVNDRLFTVWAEYDGSTDRMKISYANGDYENAVKPAAPQINKEINLANKFGGKQIYMGFTSAVASSKANHTIHSFYFSNKLDASYKLNYYLKQEDGSYVLDKTTDPVDGAVGNTAKAENVNADYRDEYNDNDYVYSTTHKQDTSVKLEEPGKTYEMNVYYDPAPEKKAKYKLTYHKLNPATGEYEKIESTPEKEGNVGDTYEVKDVDPNYESKYKGYIVNKTKNDTYTVKLDKADETYEMNVYYDPVPEEKAKYKLTYHKLNPATGEYEKIESTPEKEGNVGDTYEVKDVDPNYESKYKGYTVNKTKNDTYTVKLDKADETYEMNVYYDPVPEEKAKYKINYYKLDPVTGKYELAYSTAEQEGDVGDICEVAKLDPTYQNRYIADGYTVNVQMDDTYTVKLEEADKTYEMNVYYVPQKTTYKTEHYLKQEDGSYKLTDTVPGEETYAGKSVNAVEREYPGYTHVHTKDSVETDVVKADGSTTLKVYYDPEPKTPAYRLNYYKLNPNTGKYEYITSTGTIVGTQGDTKRVEDAAPDYEEKYLSDGYTVNTTKNEKWTVTLEDADEIYDMDVYYDPNKVSYKTNYYLKQPDGTYKLQESVTGPETYAGKNVDAEIKTYDGYQHVKIPDTLETATVDADGTTTLKVYYDPEPDPIYTVEYYVQQPDGSYKLYRDPTKLEGKTGETVTAEIISINGYVHTTTENTKESDTVLADGSTVLKVYYNLVPTQEPTTQAPTTETPTTTEADEEEADEEEDDEEEPEKKTTKSAKTGDETNFGFLFTIMLSAVTGGAVCLYIRKKEEE